MEAELGPQKMMKDGQPITYETLPEMWPPEARIGSSNWHESWPNQLSDKERGKLNSEAEEVKAAIKNEPQTRLDKLDLDLYIDAGGDPEVKTNSLIATAKFRTAPMDISKNNGKTSLKWSLFGQGHSKIKNIEPIPATVPGSVQQDCQKALDLPDPHFRDQFTAYKWMEDVTWLYKRTYLLNISMRLNLVRKFTLSPRELIIIFASVSMVRP